MTAINDNYKRMRWVKANFRKTRKYNRRESPKGIDGRRESNQAKIQRKKEERIHPPRSQQPGTYKMQMEVRSYLALNSWIFGLMDEIRQDTKKWRIELYE